MYSEEIEFIKNVIISSYEKCIKNTQVEVTKKSSHAFKVDYVTTCDLKTEKYIITEIKNKYKTDTIISEETNATAQLNGRTWILDPIDGTINFSRKIDMWCIQLAFVDDGKVQFSVIYIPEHNELFVADRTALYVNNKKIALCNNEKKASECILNIWDLQTNNTSVFNTQAKIIKSIGKKINKIKMFGSAGYEFCMSACGRIDGYLIMTENIWDILPGLHICEMAGLKTISFKKGNLIIAMAVRSNELFDMVLPLIK